MDSSFYDVDFSISTLLRSMPIRFLAFGRGFLIHLIFLTKEIFKASEVITNHVYKLSPYCTVTTNQMCKLIGLFSMFEKSLMLENDISISKQNSSSTVLTVQVTVLQGREEKVRVAPSSLRQVPPHLNPWFYY